MRGLRLIPLLALLGACASAPPLPEAAVADPAAAWRAHSRWLGGVNKWTVEGRIAIRSHDQAVTATLHWQQDGDRYQILLSGPLGSGTISLRGEEGRVRLVSDSEDVVATDAEALLFEHTGLVVPIAALRYWVRGLPQPKGSDRYRLDPQGRLARIDQAQWQVQYRAYTQVASHPLPQKVFVDNHQLSVRIVIDKWTLPRS